MLAPLPIAVRAPSPAVYMAVWRQRNTAKKWEPDNVESISTSGSCRCSSGFGFWHVGTRRNGRQGVGGSPRTVRVARAIHPRHESQRAGRRTQCARKSGCRIRQGQSGGVQQACLLGAEGIHAVASTRAGDTEQQRGTQPSVEHDETKVAERGSFCAIDAARRPVGRG